MEAVDKVIWPTGWVGQMLETLMFAATAIVGGGGTIATCLPGVLGLV